MSKKRKFQQAREEKKTVEETKEDPSNTATKSGRLIVRNLPHFFKRKHLRDLFEKQGKVIEVNIPLMDVKGQEKAKGFGFIQMEDRPAALKAIKELNGIKFKGRIIAVDMALPSGKYKEQAKLEGEQQQAQNEEEAENQENSIESEEEEKQLQFEQEKKKESKPKNYVDKDRMVFVRNIPLELEEDQFFDFFKKFGKLKYAKLVMKGQAHSGTGFLAFHKKEDAAKVLKFIENEDTTKKKKQQQTLEEHLELKGRRLYVQKVLSKEEIKEMDEKKEEEKRKDKRNMSMLSYGLTNCKEFHSQDIPEAEMVKRKRYFFQKQEAIKRSPNLSISRSRVMIRNIPTHGITKQDIVEMFEMSEEEWRKQDQNKGMNKRLIKGVKIVKRKEKHQETEKNAGYAFAEFYDEEFAKQCIRDWNNKQMLTHVKKKMILDFALQDARIQRKKEDRRLKRKEESKLKRKEELSKEEDEDDKALKKLKLEDVSDADLLMKIAQFTTSRGRKQRALKKLRKLQGREQKLERVMVQEKEVVKEEEKKTQKQEQEPAEQKREKALRVRKSREANKEIEKEIMGELKRKKKKREKEQIDSLDKALFQRKNLFE